ncbi:MAG TPA: SDR family oxidoreductase [Gemmatimonadales bacterium]|jgi:NAD(P)-dependent dehydrogenase (short-subunit alcohol dehydrogenase family)|nr:SDR family oxidoreductase [Gemmatimonadales bacterium]
MRIEGKVLVTGATRGIGRASVQRIVAAGGEVIGMARRPPEDDFPGVFYACDLLDRNATARTLAQIVAAHDVAGLVNNAGLNHVQGLEEVDLDRFDEVIAVNVRAAIQCAQAVVPGMRSRGYGRIVNVSSRGALGRIGRTSYAAAKAGIVGMSRTWAMELAPAGITVNAVSPGATATEMFMRNNAALIERFISGIPMARLAEPDEIAAAIEFLLSREASYVTGQLLHVCGGASVGLAPL